MGQVRVSEDAEKVVSQLAAKRGVSKARIVEEAIENLHRIVFFPEYERKVMAELDYYRRRDAELGAKI
ncbi:MAG TPA: ribbon-helix-helix protein, CopG family [Pyrinomonadaceae bacterium]|jgi:predicted transcriptional regulator